jgi:hypothetical protein
MRLAVDETPNSFECNKFIVSYLFSICYALSQNVTSRFESTLFV